MTTQIKQIIAETRRLEKEATPAEQFSMDIVQGDCIHRLNPGSRQVLNMGSAWIVSHDGRSQHSLRNDKNFIIFVRKNVTAILDYIEGLELEVEAGKEDIIGLEKIIHEHRLNKDELDFI